jgi:hypothetical protein
MIRREAASFESKAHLSLAGRHRLWIDPRFMWTRDGVGRMIIPMSHHADAVSGRAAEGRAHDREAPGPEVRRPAL